MDLQLFARVLWRFRFLMIAAVFVAASVAVLSTAKVSLADGKPKLAFRQNESWNAYSVILVTQSGVPPGRSASPSAPSLDLTGLALLYAELADSDPVRTVMRRSGPITGTYTASAVTSSAGNALPLIRIDAVATTPPRATRTAAVASAALIRYISDQQNAAHISKETRVVLSRVERGERPELLKGRSLARPVAAFVVILALFAGLAFALENLRPNISGRVELRSTVPDEDTTPDTASIRRMA